MAKGKYEYWLTEEGLIRLQGWCTDGLTDEQIAENIGINVATLYTWKNKHSKIDDALKKGKEIVDRQVENALLKKALGIDKRIKKPIKVKKTIYENGKKLEEKEVIEYVDEDIYIPPDTTAQIFWLKNRKPQEWRDRKEVNVDGSINDPFKGLTTAELKKLVGDTIDK